MSEKLFTPEQIEELHKSPYVASVSPKLVRFTPEFKERFINEYGEGKTPSSIVAGMGIDPHILGRSRIYGIKNHVRAQAKREERFSDRRVFQLQSRSAATVNQKIAQMEHELVYIRQELEFIKKIMAVDRKALRECQQMQRLKKNLELSEK